MIREQYNSIRAENFSNIKRILKSGAAYKCAPPDKPDESKYAVGTLAHAMVLEGKDLRHCFALKPEGMSFTTREGKAWRAAQTLPILKEELANSVPKMAEAIANDDEAATIIRMNNEREKLITAKIQGIEFKGLLDAFGKDTGNSLMHSDLKTVIDASAQEFAKTVSEFDYDLQDAIYTQLIAIKFDLDYRPPSVWVAVEKSPPYEVACYYPSADMIQCGEWKLEICIARYKEYTRTGIWPKALGGLNKLEVPEWHYRKVRNLAAAI